MLVDCRLIADLSNLLYHVVPFFPFCLMVAADQVCILYPTQQLCSEDTTSSPRNANSEDALPSLQQLKSNFKIRDLPVRVSSGAWQHTPTLRQRFPARCQTHECGSMVLLTLKKRGYMYIYTCIIYMVPCPVFPPPHGMGGV